MADSLEKLKDLNTVENIGPLSRNAEWYLTLKTHDHVELLLEEGDLICRDYIRIYWLEPWVAPKYIIAALQA